MKKEISDQMIEQAIARKGEQEAIKSMANLPSAERLRQIMHQAECKYRAPWLRRWVSVSIAVAAVIAVVLMIGWQPRYSNEALYERWNEQAAYEPIVARGIDEAQKDFELALALVQTGESDRAIEEFLRIASNHTADYAEEALWQLTMLYLRTNQRILAQETLQVIIKNKGESAPQAQKLILEITKKRWF